MIAEVSLAKSKEIKKKEVEDIKKSSEFLKSNLLTKAEVKKAIEDAIDNIKDGENSLGDIEDLVNELPDGEEKDKIKDIE